MKWLQRTVYCLFVSFVFTMLFLGCTGIRQDEAFQVSGTLEKRQSLHSQDYTNLDEWLGDYVFYEFYPPNINMDYNIKLYKKKTDYYAKIHIDGFQTSRRIKAKVISKKDGIDLVFETYLPENDFTQELKKGDILLSLEKDKSKIYTYWGKIEPILPENLASGKVCFEKKS